MISCETIRLKGSLKMQAGFCQCVFTGLSFNTQPKSEGMYDLLAKRSKPLSSSELENPIPDL